MKITLTLNGTPVVIEGDISDVVLDGTAVVPLPDPAEPDPVEPEPPVDPVEPEPPVEPAAAFTTAFISCFDDHEMTVLDIAGNQSTVLGGVTNEALMGGIIGSYIEGDTVFATSNREGTLTAFDVTTRTNPLILGSVDLTTGRTRDVVVVDGVALVTSDSDSTVYTVDVSDPASGMPVLGSLTDDLLKGCENARVDTVRKLAFIRGKTERTTAAGRALMIVSFADPTSPEIVAILEMDGMFALDYDQQRQVVVCSLDLLNSIVAVDVSIPTNPVEIGRLRDDVVLAGARGITIDTTRPAVFAATKGSNNFVSINTADWADMRIVSYLHSQPMFTDVPEMRMSRPGTEVILCNKGDVPVTSGNVARINVLDLTAMEVTDNIIDPEALDKPVRISLGSQT